jgi:hypothetical protein
VLRPAANNAGRGHRLRLCRSRRSRLPELDAELTIGGVGKAAYGSISGSLPASFQATLPPEKTRTCAYPKAVSLRIRGLAFQPIEWGYGRGLPNAIRSQG